MGGWRGRRRRRRGPVTGRLWPPVASHHSGRAHGRPEGRPAGRGSRRLGLPSPLRWALGPRPLGRKRKPFRKHLSCERLAGRSGAARGAVGCVLLKKGLLGRAARHAIPWHRRSPCGRAEGMCDRTALCRVACSALSPSAAPDPLPGLRFPLRCPQLHLLQEPVHDLHKSEIHIRAS